MASYTELKPSTILPACPMSWFYLCQSSELKQKPRAYNPLGRELVAFRTSEGKPVLLDARCSHFGANLCHGRVEGNQIRCAFHGWKYDEKGRCVETPYQGKAPVTARQRSFPLEERHGQVFFFNGPIPLFPLPFFANELPENFISSSPIRFSAQSTWYVVAANSWDIVHFEIFHRRKAKMEPKVGETSPFSYHIDATHDVIGDSVLDRFIRFFIGKQVRVTVDVWGGNYLLLTSKFYHGENHFIFSVRPDGENHDHLRAELLPYVRKSKNTIFNVWAKVITIPMRKIMTDAFFRKESRSLDGLRYNSKNAMLEDKPVLDFMAWLAKVPQSSPSESI